MLKQCVYKCVSVRGECLLSGLEFSYAFMPLPYCQVSGFFFKLFPDVVRNEVFYNAVRFL